ncbi:cytochrome C oxidase [Flavobacterium psychrophilum]|nr:cytochrome C oxidase [Flavobacterium psychrophilum]
MKLKNKNLISKPQKKFTLLGLMAFFYPLIASAQTDNGVSFFPNKSIGFIEILTIFVMIIVGFVLFLVLKIITKANDNLEDTNLGNDKKLKNI